MTDESVVGYLKEFNRAILDECTSPYEALYNFAVSAVGVKLFTVMEVDLDAGIARRPFSSNPKEYPVSGSKPICRNRWFDIVFKDKKAFVANTAKDFVDVFPDHELIVSLGCESVVNLPIFAEEKIVGTVNLLHEKDFYNYNRLKLITNYLPAPAAIAYSETKSKNA